MAPPPDADPLDGPTLAAGADGLPTAGDGAGQVWDPAIAHQLSTAERGQRYQLGALLGRGGMGEVVAALDTRVGREVAVKRLRDPGNPEATARLLREGRVQGRLEHPAVPPVHDLDVDEDDQPFIAMKRLTGATLAQILQLPGAGDPAIAGQYARPKLLRAFIDVCLAVEFAHTRGVIHRDLKPSNIILGDFGECYVLDWGVAYLAGEPKRPRSNATPPLGSLSVAARAALAASHLPGPEASLMVTRDSSEDALSGAVVGTPGYMAPEQLHGETEPAAAVDIYSLGCVLFELLSGEPLHPRGQAAMTSTLEGCDARPSARSPGREVPPELDAICVRATSMAPADRFPSARALADAVSAHLDGDRDHAMRAELARVELDLAQRALEGLQAADDPERRKLAMRAAARALALDPTLTDAAELVSLLMLRRPDHVPPEVQRRLDELDAEGARAHGALVRVAFVGYLLMLPLLLWAGVRSWLPIVLAYGGLIVHVVVASLPPRGRATGRRRLLVNVGINVGIIFLLGRMVGPFVVAPALAATMLLIYATHPYATRLLLLWGVFLGAALLPWVLELAGVLPSTQHVEGGLFTMTSSFLDLRPVPAQLLPIGFTVVLLTVAGYHAYRLTRRNREAQVHLELQAWQLSQLVPSASPRSGVFTSLVRTMVRK